MSRHSESERVCRPQPTAPSIAQRSGWLSASINMDLYEHQKKASDLLVANRRFALWYEMGTGKTATVLDAIRRLNPRRVLVVCPLSIIDAAWKRDAARFAPGISIAGFHDRPRQAFWESQIGVINYESFRLRREDLWKQPPDLLVIDESSRLKDPQSQTSRLLREFARECERVVLLSGTPAPNDALEYWAQLYAIDPLVLGRNYYSFRFQFGRAERIYVAGGNKVDKWKANPDRIPELLQRISTVSHTLRKEDCLDLPDKVDEVLEIGLGNEERRAYETMKDDMILQFSDPEAVVTADNVLAEMSKLRQIVNGWCYDEQHKPRLIGQSKLTALRELLDDIGQSAIIWVEFREDAHRLKEALGRRAVELIGSLSNTARQDAITGFQSGLYRWLIAHPQAAGHGLTFVNACYAIFYGLGYSFEYHQQARDRIHRIGQKRKCTYIYLLAKDTVEQDILSVVQGKATAHQLAQSFLSQCDKEVVGGTAT